MKWEKVVVEMVGSWAGRFGARTGFPLGPCLLYTRHSGRLALVFGLGGGGGSGSTGEAREVWPASDENTHIPTNWVKEQVATTTISNNTSMMVGRALLIQGTNHGSVGIGAEVVVVAEGGPTLGAGELVLVLVGGVPGVDVEVVVVVVVVVALIEGWCTGEGARELTATARPGRALSTSMVGELSVGGWLVKDVTRGVDKSEVLVIGGAVIADWLDKEVARGVDKSKVLVVVGAVLAEWLDKEAAWGVDRSTVLVVGGAVIAEGLDKETARGWTGPG